MKNITNVLIETRNVSKRFNGTLALDNVSIRLEKGKRLGIIGGNGSGKTTLLNVLCRLIEPDRGDILLKGKSYKKINAHHLAQLGIARSFQHSRNWKNMSLSDNLLAAGHNPWRERYWYSFFRRKKFINEERQMWEKASKILEYFEMENMNIQPGNPSDKTADNLSIGEQRLLELIRIFFSEPEVLLLDEPSVGLNPRKCQLLTAFLKKLAEKDKGILIIAHDLDFLRKNTDFIYFMNQGRILSQGTVDEILKKKQVLEAYLGNT
jgi:branched-chain amino acid transport system ATP-binding protein